MIDLRAILVAVDYTDLLEVTLPLNRHHFVNVMIVTSPADKDKIVPLAKRYDCCVSITNRFYDNGASFNKWAALEYSLDLYGRRGVLCLMDADVVWPQHAPVRLERGQLLSPLRRMAPWPPLGDDSCPICRGRGLKEQLALAKEEGFFLKETVVCPCGIKAEASWHRYGIHRNVNEWAGYTQIFHADDPHLPAPPWHSTEWVHAGGADSFFQQLWPADAKIRPSWECLHLGEAGQNWYGRATQFANGTAPPQAQERRGQCSEIWDERRRLRAAGATGDEVFKAEKLGG